MKCPQLFPYGFSEPGFCVEVKGLPLCAALSGDELTGPCSGEMVCVQSDVDDCTHICRGHLAQAKESRK